MRKDIEREKSLKKRSIQDIPAAKSTKMIRTKQTSIMDIYYELPQEDIGDIKKPKNAESVGYIRMIIEGFIEKKIEILHGGGTDLQ